MKLKPDSKQRGLSLFDPMNCGSRSIYLYLKVPCRYGHLFGKAILNACFVANLYSTTSVGAINYDSSHNIIRIIHMKLTYFYYSAIFYSLLLTLFT